MNLRSSKSQSGPSQDGGILIVTLFVVTTVFIALGSYLMLVRAQYVSVSRSQSWNAALTLAESGLEEALAQLNPGALATNYVDRSANHWGAPNNGIYGPATRTVTSNTSYSVVFTTDTPPTIYSTGYCTIGDLSATLTRVVRVSTATVPMYNMALAAMTNMTLNGNGI